MTVRANKPAFNIREKLTELKHKPVELISVHTPEIFLSGSNNQTIEGIHETDHPIYLRINASSVSTAGNMQKIRFGTEKDGILSTSIYYWQSSYANHNSTTSVYNENPGSFYNFQYGWTASGNIFYTIIKIQRLAKANTTNRYFAQMIGVTNPGYPTYVNQSCCRVDLPGPLHSIDFYTDTTSGNTFDGGAISVQYIYERNL